MTARPTARGIGGNASPAEGGGREGLSAKARKKADKGLFFFLLPPPPAHRRLQAEREVGAGKRLHVSGRLPHTSARTCQDLACPLYRFAAVPFQASRYI